MGAGLIVLGVLHGVTTREAIAANRYWVLATGSSGSYNSTARWSTTSNGSSGASVPGPSDVAIFDGGNGTKQGACTSTTDWKGIQITSNYTGTVTSSATLNLGTDGFVQGGGTFVAPSTRLTVSGAFTRTGGTFTPNSGLVMLTAASGNRTFATNNGSFHDLMINDGLVGYWKLDDGTTPISDRSGYGHSGTLYNIPTWGAGTTALQFSNGNAMVLNGTDEYARISRTTTLEPTAVSVSIWIKRNGNQSQYARIVDKTYSNGGAAPYQSYALQMNNNATKHGQIHWEVGLSGGGTSSSSSGDTTITDGTWHHVVGVYDPAGSAPQQRLYINGVLYASATVTTALAYDTATTGDLYFGQSGGSNQYFKGTIDDLRIYNRGLTSADVATLYAGGQRVTSAATHTLSGTITTTGELVLASGTLDASASGCSSASCGITVGETWYSYGGTFTPRTGTVAFNGTGSILSDWSPFYDLSVTGTGTVTLLDRLNVTNTLGMSANGTLAGSTYVIRAGTMNKTTGTISGSGSIVLAPTANLNLTVNNVGLPLRLESPKDDGLVGYWKLDDGRGGTAADSSGNGYDGALYNGAGWTTNTPGTMPIDDAGSIALTSTSSQYVRIPRNTTLEPAAVTVAAWIKRSGNQNRYAKLIIKTYNNNTSAPWQSYALQMNNSGTDHGQVHWELGLSGSANSGVSSASNSVVDNTWTHVVGVYDPAGAAPQQRLYINGELFSSATSTTALAYYTTSAGDLYFGQSGNNEQYFAGSIDDVRIYNRGLSSNEVAALYSHGYTTGSTATLTLAATAAMGSTFRIDSGILNASSFANAVTGAVTINGGEYQVGTATAGQTFSAGLQVNRYGRLSLLSSGGTVKVGASQTLTMDGTLTAASSGATIQSASGRYAFSIGSTATATPTLNISGLAVKDTDANGMNVNVNHGATTTFTRFDNLAFSAGAGTGAGIYNLQIYAASLYLTANNCTFDNGATATVVSNVKLTGNGAGDGETRIVFGNATCASNKASCESYDDDDDDANNVSGLATPDGVGDASCTDCAVVQWIQGAHTDVAGSVEGFPTAAFDWNTFTWYSTYVTYRDVSGTVDRVYARKTNGDSYYYWDTPAGVDLIGTPRWDTVGSTHHVYVATTSGKVYRLVDNTTAHTLTVDTTSPWDGANNPFDCGCTIATPLAQDTNNLYFGGSASATYKLWTVSKTSTTRQPMGSPLATGATTNNAAPAVWSSGGTYVFLGQAGRVTKLNTTTQAVTGDNVNPGGTNAVTGRITIVNNTLYAGDDGGSMWSLDPGANFTSLAGLHKNWGYRDVTNHGACGGVCQVRNHYVDPSPASGRTYYGDQDGHLYVLNASGVAVTGYPWRPGTSADAFATAPLHRGNVIVIGSTSGNLYIVDQSSDGSTPALVQKYKFGGTGTAVSGIAYDSNNAAYMISTANETTKDGKLYYITAVSDPTPSFP